MKDTKDKIVRDLAKWRTIEYNRGIVEYCQFCLRDRDKKCERSCLGYRARKLAGKGRQKHKSRP